ncbi:MAG: phosphoribosyl-AMP cyclohydrolase [Ignavibacteriales bacterium]|nr:phosphoribosyl-AMP cyclohydrolase [Ignavibacteriales bacterium]
MKILDMVKFTEDGLIPAIAQDAATGEILMMAWMNRESLHMTVESKRATYWSRSRNKLWIKGEESGNIQEVSNISTDCDADVILLKIRQVGAAACHTGHRSCFYRDVTENGDALIENSSPLFDPKQVYKK